jgi:hypothetical protein
MIMTTTTTTTIIMVIRMVRATPTCRIGWGEPLRLASR